MPTLDGCADLRGMHFKAGGSLKFSCSPTPGRRKVESSQTVVVLWTLNTVVCRYALSTSDVVYMWCFAAPGQL
jgi:hypothetical protein